MTQERFALTADDGFVLAAARWLPSGTIRAVLQIAHGMAEHKERYADFAEACTAAGIAVYIYDHRGHGGSVDASTPIGHYADRDGWHKVIGDLHTALTHARTQHHDVPVFLFAHSMGSFMARGYLVDHGTALAGAILSATGFRLGLGNLALAGVARVEALRRGARTPSKVMSKLAFGSFNLQFLPTRTASDWLSRDPAQVDRYLADPLCGFDCSGRMWADLLGAVYGVERAEDDPLRVPRLPLLTIAGTRDPVSMGGKGNTQVADRYKAAGNPDVTDKRYEGARHELLNETNRAEVYADVIKWVEQRSEKK